MEYHHNNHYKDGIINNEEKNYITFKRNEDTLQRGRKSITYKKINLIRAKLLKIIDNETKNYSKQITMINSKSTPNYLKTFNNNYTINLKKKEIKSTIESGVSFDSTNIPKHVKKLIDLDLHPFIFKCNHHYYKFKKRKKIVLSKKSGYLRINDNSFNNSFSPSSNEFSPNRERNIFMITGKISFKIYFNYLHSLFYSLHKNFYSGKVESIIKYKSGNLYKFSNQVKKFNSEYKRKSSPVFIKKKNNINNNTNNKDNSNENKSIKKSSSNNDLLSIIHLIQCEKK
jgi:hypothetical protein